MTAVEVDITIEQGATFRMGFTWADGVDDGSGNIVAGTPKNLTGYIARMQIRKTQGSPALVDATSTNGKILLGPPAGNDAGTPVLSNGRIVVKLSDEDTDLLNTKSAKYDLEVETATGEVYRLLKGAVTVDPNITQEGGAEPVVGA